MLEMESPTKLEERELTLAQLEEVERQAIDEYNSGKRSLAELQGQIATVRRLRAELSLPYD
jgi:hypothetical protein